jgi:hypothetical protein
METEYLEKILTEAGTLLQQPHGDQLLDSPRSNPYKQQSFFFK